MERKRNQKLWKIVKGKLLNTAIHAERDWDNTFFSSNIEVSRSSKLFAFFSLQIYHIKHKGANLQSSRVLWFPFVVSNSPTSLSPF
jgi:type IV secretory pathway TrbF-like protein